MAFLAALAAEILKWLLTIGGRALYNYVEETVAKHEKNKQIKKNTEKFKESLDKDDETRHKAGSDLINNNKRD